MSEEYQVSIANAVEDIKKKKENGEEIDPMTEEGLKAIEFANNVINSMMRKNKIDLAYFKAYMSDAERRVNALASDKKTPEPKPRSLKRKRTSVGKIKDVNESS